MTNIAIIVVTYNPDLKNLLDLIIELHNFHIYVSDNGSKNDKKIQEIVHNYSNVTLINSQENRGIAVAQNKAINRACDDKAKYIFFLDQDSFITEETLNLLKNDYLSIKKINNDLGIISAVPDDEIRSDHDNSRIEYVNEVISSGMFLSTDSIINVGNMLENLFIDMVDYEWCWRFKHHGLRIAKDFNCRFKHQIGNNKKILGKIVISPFRLYYVFRNTIYLIKTNKTLDKHCSTLLKYRLFKQFIFSVFFCPQKIKRFRYIVWGIKDANNRKMGKLNYDK
ncbi:glycosyltransferase [Limosilactobacillus reuteri subsp. suis]|uniref:glycosyltransferase n=1 Tax=Limosilactobacillus reuteri TaxID=1598 RepID=UPI00399457DF